MEEIKNKQTTRLLYHWIKQTYKAFYSVYTFMGWFNQAIYIAIRVLLFFLFFGAIKIRNEGYFPPSSPPTLNRIEIPM